MTHTCNPLKNITKQSLFDFLDSHDVECEMTAEGDIAIYTIPPHFLSFSGTEYTKNTVYLGSTEDIGEVLFSIICHMRDHDIYPDIDLLADMLHLTLRRDLGRITVFDGSRILFEFYFDKIVYIEDKQRNTIHTSTPTAYVKVIVSRLLKDLREETK